MPRSVVLAPHSRLLLLLNLLRVRLVLVLLERLPNLLAQHAPAAALRRTRVWTGAEAG